MGRGGYNSSGIDTGMTMDTQAFQTDLVSSLFSLSLGRSLSAWLPPEVLVVTSVN